MTILVIEPEDQTERLHRACDVIATRAPELSARTFLTRGQRIVITATTLLVIAGLLVSAKFTCIIGVTLCIAAYIMTVTQRVVLTHRSLAHSSVVTVTDAEARALLDRDLPVYTVLVPMYREAAVVEQ